MTMVGEEGGGGGGGGGVFGGFLTERFISQWGSL